MLNWEYLLEEARGLGLPIHKKRAILREYLQMIILNSIYKGKFSKSMFFVGGTALRFFHKLPRFSEDLDFDSSNLSYHEFKGLVEVVEKNLSYEGFSSEVSYEERGSLLAASVDFPDVMKLYNIVDRRGFSMMVKIEVNRPKWPLVTESHAISLYGYTFSAILMAKSALISEKLCALLSRGRGRDVYDLLFMLRKKFPFDRRILYANDIKAEPKRVITDYFSNLKKNEIRRLAEQVKPFLFREDDIELVLKAPEFAEKFLADYNS